MAESGRYNFGFLTGHHVFHAAVKQSFIQVEHSILIAAEQDRLFVGRNIRPAKRDSFHKLFDGVNRLTISNVGKLKKNFVGRRFDQQGYYWNTLEPIVIKN